MASIHPSTVAGIREPMTARRHHRQDKRRGRVIRTVHPPHPIPHSSFKPPPHATPRPPCTTTRGVAHQTPIYPRTPRIRSPAWRRRRGRGAGCCGGAWHGPCWARGRWRLVGGGRGWSGWHAWRGCEGGGAIGAGMPPVWRGGRPTRTRSLRLKRRRGRGGGPGGKGRWGEWREGRVAD